MLRKLADDLKLPKLTFQAIRRTIATLAQKKGTVKDVQGVLRHSRAATTTDVYMQAIPTSVQTVVDSINLELRKRSKSARQKKQIGRKRPVVAWDERSFTPNDTKPERRISVSY
ncbi:MAG TPA: hypothetical protein VG759_21710 [Candidatus Angelobacter sp.]|nr:hypothetical protein [Candidatus Angelobacter sp.]